VCGNVLCDTTPASNDCDNGVKVVSFKCQNTANELVECKPGQTINTQNGGELCIDEKGNFSFSNNHVNSSINVYVECNTCDKNGKVETSTMCIHTPDVKPDTPNYIVDSSEICSPNKISVCDLGIKLDTQDNGNSSSNKGCSIDNILNAHTCDPVAQNTSPHSSISSNAPCYITPANCTQSVEQHVTQACHEVHVLK
jgi:hypothetical protein